MTLNKRGRMLSASYEAIPLPAATGAVRRHPAADRQNSIARRKLKDAVERPLIGTGDDGGGETVCATSGTLAYSDLLKLWQARGL